MIPAFRHLEARTRIGELTFGQWASVFAGLMVAAAVVLWLHPFGMYIDLIIGIYAGGVPVVVAFIVSIGEFNIWLLIRAIIHWRRHDGRYTAGPGTLLQGYRILESPQDHRFDAPAELDYEALWETTGSRP